MACPKHFWLPANCAYCAWIEWARGRELVRCKHDVETCEWMKVEGGGRVLFAKCLECLNRRVIRKEPG